MSADPAPLKIFMSCGTAYTDQQKKFVGAFEEFLLRNGCKPHTVGQSVYRARQPVLSAREEIQSCAGAIVLAFTRYEIESAIEYPQSKKASPMERMKLPTIWNQLEGGMAYGLDLPLLILTEKGMKRQGILSDRIEWFPQEIELLPSVLKDKAFNGIFEDWKKRAVDQSTKKAAMSKSKIAGMSMMELASAIGVHTGVRIVIALGSLLSAVFAFGFWAGGRFG